MPSQRASTMASWLQNRVQSSGSGCSGFHATCPVSIHFIFPTPNHPFRFADAHPEPTGRMLLPICRVHLPVRFIATAPTQQRFPFLLFMLPRPSSFVSFSPPSSSPFFFFPLFHPPFFYHLLLSFLLLSSSPHDSPPLPVKSIWVSTEQTSNAQDLGINIFSVCSLYGHLSHFHFSLCRVNTVVTHKSKQMAVFQ